MATIGSVFLGDGSRRRFPSTSTPPSSPPASATLPSMMAEISPPPAASTFDAPKNGGTPPVIDPELSLELRLRWLEALLVGVKPKEKVLTRKGKEKAVELKPGTSLLRAAEDIQRRLNTCVEASDGIKRFMDNYDQHAHLLTPSFALSGLLPDPPVYDDMSPSELEAFLAEMEPDVRAADRDLREIEALEQKGVTEAGNLTTYEELQPRLDALVKAHEEDARLAESLEQRIAVVMERHATQVDALSELFVAWDDTITDAEDKTSRLERDRSERRRLGLEE